MIFFKSSPDPKNSSYVTVEAIENDNVIGSCNMQLKADRAEIISVTCNDKDFVLFDGLIKSAFNYAAVKNCYMGYINCINFSHFLDQMSLKKENGVYFNDIPTILQGNCCKMNHNI